MVGTVGSEAAGRAKVWVGSVMVMVERAFQRGSFVCTVPYRLLFMLFVIYVYGHQNRWKIRVKIVQRISYLHIRCMGGYLVYYFKKHGNHIYF